MKNVTFIFVFFSMILSSSNLIAQGWTGTSNNLIYAIDNAGMVNPNVNVGIGANMALAKLHILGDSGIRIEATTPNNPNVSDAFMRIEPEVLSGLPNHTANNMNQISTAVGSRVTGRRFGHLFMDIIANEQADAFAVRVDNGDDGTIDNVPFIVRASGNVGVGQLDPQRIFNTNGQIRFENLPTANRSVSLLGVDGNGDVFVTNCNCNASSKKSEDYDLEIEDLQSEVDNLREELNSLKELISENLRVSDLPANNELTLEQRAKLIVYPNPTTTEITVKTPIKGTSKMVITDYSGLELIVKDFDGRSTLNLEELPTGIYFVTITDETGIRTEKFVKK